MFQVTGVKSQLGRSLAEEFAKGGCYVICVDSDLKSVETIASDLSAKYPTVQNIGYRKDDRELVRSSTRAYECDLYDRADIQTVAQRVKDEVGRVDVLVTCAGQVHYDIFDTVSKTLMSHYWVSDKHNFQGNFFPFFHMFISLETEGIKYRSYRNTIFSFWFFWWNICFFKFISFWQIFNLEEDPRE